MTSKDLPVINWLTDFPDGDIPSGSGTGKKIILIGFDTEYQSNFTVNNNLCLSYQYALYSLFDGTYKSGILFPDLNQNERFSWSEFTNKVFKEAHILPSQLAGYRIIFIAHYFSAEWAMFRDKKELTMKFEFIRKSMVTRKPLKTKIVAENGRRVECWVDVSDTMLLLPDGFKSLALASTLLGGFEKIALEAEMKSNMYDLLQQNPEQFIEYAIRDAEVTLKLFVKLQYMLNRINGESDKLFLTLASATTNDFIKFSKATTGATIHDMQFDRKHHLYKQYEALANRSYMGGLNSSYHVGKADGYTFIDIDFKNAYPTAMNVIQVGDFGDPYEKYERIPVDLTGLES